MSTATLAPASPFLATTRLQVERVVQALLRSTSPLALDTETTGLNPRQNKLVALQVQQGETAIIVDLRRDPSLVKLFQPVVDQRLIVGHNLKFDLQFLLANGLRIPHVFDTMLAEQVWLGLGKSEARERGLGLTLKEVSARYDLGEMSKEERNWFIDLDTREGEWDEPFPMEQIAYMARDTEVLLPLYRKLSQQLEWWKLQEAVELEMRALPAIARMELIGIRIDIEGWRAFIEEKRKEARAAEDKALAVFGPAILDKRLAAYDTARGQWEAARAALKLEEERQRTLWEVLPDGKPMWGEWKKEAIERYRATHLIPAKPKLVLDPPNLDSQPQLLSAFVQLGIPIQYKRNDKGERVPTTDSESLEKLAVNHPDLRLLLEYRTAKKFVESFGESLLQYAEEEEGGVWALHPDYNSIGAGTGRMSCSNPNFQQVPHKGDGERLRELVIARPGRKLLTADFSNIELRILADLANDEQMLAMFASGEDLHARTAKLLFKLPEEWGKKETSSNIWKGGQSYRQAAKIVNYLIPYGGSAFAMALQNDMPLEDAEELMKGWFAVFGGVKAYLEQQSRDVHQTLKSRTVSGRWRRYSSPPAKPEQQWKVYDAQAPVPEGYIKVKRDGKTQLVEATDHYQQRLKKWQRAWSAIERQARNSPIQGSSADITKLAVALFSERCPRAWAAIVAVVHDEIVVEALERAAGRVAEMLAQAMYDACVHYLHRVTIPWPEVNISEVWFHD